MRPGCTLRGRHIIAAAPIPEPRVAMKRIGPSAALSAALVTAACGAGDPSTDAHLDDVPALTLTEVFRAGSVDDPDAGFTAIGAVDVADDGTIYLYESRAREVRVLGAGGEPLHRFGGPGSGPGEFANTPTFLGVLGDTVWAIQLSGMMQVRLSLFDRAGTHLSTRVVTTDVRVPYREDRIRGFAPSALLPGDRLEGNNRFGLPARDAGPYPSVGDTVPMPRVIFDLDGNVVDTLGYDPYVVEPNLPPLRTVNAGGSELRLPREPSDAPETILVPDGRIVVHGPTPAGPEDARITFTHVTFAGDTVAHRVLRHTPEPYAEAFLDSLAARSARGGGSAMVIENGVIVGAAPPPDDVEGATRIVRDALDFGPYPPPVTGARLTEDGAVLVWLQENGGPRQPLLLLGPDGEPRGRFDIPANAGVPWASSAELLVVERDAFDVPWLVKYRVE